ncbi:MAG: ABC transporter substrate-binding protein [Mycobacteriaceae bacterium]
MKLHVQPKIALLVIVVLVCIVNVSCANQLTNKGCGVDIGTGTTMPEKLTIGVANNIAMAAPVTQLNSLGIDSVDIKTASTPEELRTNFISGRYDVAAMPINIAANLCSQGVDLALLGTVSGEILHLMGPVGTTLKDLRGQKVDIPFPNDIVDLLTRTLFAKIGMDDTELRYHPTPLEIASGLSSGAITYAVLPEHLATVVERTSPNIIKAMSVQELWKEQTGASALPFVGFVVRGEIARRYPSLVTKLNGSFLNSIISATSNPSLGGEEISKVIPVPADLSADILPSLKPTYLPAQVGRVDMEILLKALLELNRDSVGGALPQANFYLPT